MTPSAKRLTAITALALSLFATSVPAHAAEGEEGGGKGPGGPEQDAGGYGANQQVAAKVQSTRVQTKVSGGNGRTKTGALSPKNTNWKPPACWYEPAYSPKELKAMIEGWEDFEFMGMGPALADFFKLYFQTDKYDNFNMKKQGKGEFWTAVVNPSRKDEPEAMSCDKPPFWVDENDTPDEPLAVSPKILAEYAYDELPVPDTDITMDPAGKQTVNLDTWVWLNKATFKPVSVTASLPGTGLSATTTATPTALSLEPGTQDATLHPASGECRIGKDGSIGEPYTDAKKNKTPPCGITYLRATDATGPHKLKATVSWKISWKSTNGEGGGLPDGAFGTTRDVTVREVQSINR